MKKSLQFLTAVLITGLILFSGCQKDELADYEQAKSNQPVLKDDPVYCGDVITASIVDANESVNAGTLTVGNDENYVYITFTSADDWVFNSTYLYAGAVDTLPGYLNDDGTGDFAQWYFTYRDWHAGGINEKTYVYDIDDLDETFYVVAYTNIYNTSTAEEYIGWGKNGYKALTPGFYLQYTKQVCAPPPPLGYPQLSFAYDDQTAVCFKDLKRRNATYNPNGSGTWKNFMLWGWRNGDYAPGTYTFDLWAGAQGCDPENGTLVGQVTLDYDGSSATVSFEVDPVYTLSSTYVYAGHKRLPKRWGRYQVVPLLYPKKHFQVNSFEDSFTINNLSGDIYFVASAVVKDAE